METFWTSPAKTCKAFAKIADGPGTRYCWWFTVRPLSIHFQLSRGTTEDMGRRIVEARWWRAWRWWLGLPRHGMCGDDKFCCLYSEDGDLQRCCYGHEQELWATPVLAHELEDNNSWAMYSTCSTKCVKRNIVNRKLFFKYYTFTNCSSEILKLCIVLLWAWPRI